MYAVKTPLTPDQRRSRYAPWARPAATEAAATEAAATELSAPQKPDLDVLSTEDHTKCLTTFFNIK